MSMKGRLLRGEKWWNLNRDANGNLTAAVQKDPQKMANINLFLEAMKKEKEAKEEPKEVKPKSKGEK